MKIKSIIFDLDGVLVSTKEIHFDALNEAIALFDKKYVISYNDHLSKFDGLPTKQKLQKLVSMGLEQKYIKEISEKKKTITNEFLEKKIQYNENIYEIFKYLKNNDYKIAIATNAIKDTLDIIINKLKLNDYIDFIISNEAVVNPKPHSEIYLKCFLSLNSNPKECLILEDSVVGRNAAYNSGAYVMTIDSIENDVTLDKIYNIINMYNSSKQNIKWKSENLNILIPIAGKGQRFLDKGYAFPKPLISIKNKPMIQVVIENLNIDANFIFIVLKEHYDKYNLEYLLPMISNENCKIVICDKITEGAASTSLLAEELIDDDNPLLIANSDQFIEWNSNEIMYSFLNSKIDGGILTFKSTHPKWSFAKVNKENIVLEVAEKKPISDNATAGIYFWKKGSEYVKYAKTMIKSDIRVNNEFYICPVFNLAIKDGKKIIIKEINEMWGLGTPEDLDEFMLKKANLI